MLYSSTYCKSQLLEYIRKVYISVFIYYESYIHIIIEIIQCIIMARLGNLKMVSTVMQLYGWLLLSYCNFCIKDKLHNMKLSIDCCIYSLCII